MAVLIEVTSVIIRREAIDDHFAGGWTAFEQTVPNCTACADPHLVRVGFMVERDADAYVSHLVAGGLVFGRDGEAVDLAIVCQVRGALTPAPWLQLGTAGRDDMRVRVAWLAGIDPGGIALPEGWDYEKSLSKNPGFTDESAKGDRLKYLRHENGIDVYLELLSGKEVFVGRPVVEGDSEGALLTQLREICHAVLKLDAQCEPLMASRDAAGLRPIFHELREQWLPKVERITSGPGREMSAAHFTRGLILRILLERPDAEAAFRTAHAMYPNDINVLLEIVRCLGEQGKPQEALPFAREAVAVDAVNPRAWGNLAMCLLQGGQLEEALKAIEYAVDLDPEDKLNRYIRDNFKRYL